MSGDVKLPDPERMFEIRFESIGGLGAHAAGQILARAAVLRGGLNGAHFSSYGSEKKGSVVRSYVRLAMPEMPIRSSAPIESPDVIIVCHAALLAHPITFAGLKANGILIYPGAEGEKPDVLANVPKTARVIRVDALRIANETRSRPNAVMLGTLQAALPFLAGADVLGALGDEFRVRHPEAVATNEAAFHRGMTEIEEITGVGTAEGDLPISRPGPIWGYETAPIGGVLPVPGNTVHNDLTTSRIGHMPVFTVETCINCGMCDMVCPDLCLSWQLGEDGEAKLHGVDYQYCKACFRCVESCPTGALVIEEETPGKADKLRVPLFEEFKH